MMNMKCVLISSVKIDYNYHIYVIQHNILIINTLTNEKD